MSSLVMGAGVGGIGGGDCHIITPPSSSSVGRYQQSTNTASPHGSYSSGGGVSGGTFYYSAHVGMTRIRYKGRDGINHSYSSDDLYPGTSNSLISLYINHGEKIYVDITLILSTGSSGETVNKTVELTADRDGIIKISVSFTGKWRFLGDASLGTGVNFEYSFDTVTATGSII